MPAKSNYLSDCFSRLPLADSKFDLEANVFAVLLKELQSNGVSSTEITKVTEYDLL